MATTGTPPHLTQGSRTKGGIGESTLRPDGTLLKYTAACGTSIYRDNVFPPDFAGTDYRQVLAG